MPASAVSPARDDAGRRTASRRACAAVLTGLATFAALQLAAAPLVERCLPGVVDPDYGARLARVPPGRAADPGRTRLVVMLGSSRTYYALRPEVIDGPLSRELGRPASVVNFSYTGAGPVTELLTWRRLRRDGVRPDLVLVEVLPAFLSSTFPTDELNEAIMPADRLRGFDVPLLERYGARPTLRGEVMLAEANPYYTRRVGILNAVARDLLPRGDERSLDPVLRRTPPACPGHRLRPHESQYGRALAWATYGATLTDFRLGGRGCAALRELLASCRQAGVPAALVLTPEGPTFRSWYAPAAREQIDGWLAATGREYGVPVIDARTWIDDEDQFLDSHHLLPSGAARFTERLGREYLLPLLRGAPAAADGGVSDALARAPSAP